MRISAACSVAIKPMVEKWKLARYVHGELWKEEGRNKIRPTAELRSAAKSGMRHEVHPSIPPRPRSTAVPARSSIPQRRRGKAKEVPIGRSATRICQVRGSAGREVRMAVRRRRYTRYGDEAPSKWREVYAMIASGITHQMTRGGHYLGRCSMPGYLSVVLRGVPPYS